VSGVAFNDTVAANLLAWTAQLCAIAAATCTFYTLVEAPFHRLARRPGTRHSRNRATEEALTSS
jgi:peptidoglycan/LPS O-acetylase OafA/YrhL